LAPYWPHRQPDSQILGSKARERLGIKLHEPWWPGPGSNRRPSAVQMEVIAGQARSCWSDRTRWTSKRTFQPVVPRLTADSRRTDFVAQPRGWTRCTTPASCIGMARRDAAFATVPTHHVNGLLTSGGDPNATPSIRPAPSCGNSGIGRVPSSGPVMLIAPRALRRGRRGPPRRRRRPDRPGREGV